MMLCAKYEAENLSVSEKIFKVLLHVSIENEVPWGGANFDPRGIIYTNFVEDLQMMLCTKDES